MRGLRALVVGFVAGGILLQTLAWFIARHGDVTPARYDLGCFLLLAVLCRGRQFGVVEAAVARAAATLPLLSTFVRAGELSVAMHDAMVIATALVVLGVYGLVRGWAGGVLALALAAVAAFVAVAMEIAAAVSPGWLAPHVCAGPREHLDLITWTALAIAIGLTVAVVPLAQRVRRALA